MEVSVTQTLLNVQVQPSSGPEITVSIVAAPVLQLQAVGLQGPQGTAGTGSIIAGLAVGGHRAITAQGLYPTSATLDLVLGITLGAALSGQSVNYVNEGPIVEGSWAWTPGLPIFVGVNGVLTQTEPAGTMRRIATAITATSLLVDLQPTIYRSP